MTTIQAHFQDCLDRSSLEFDGEHYQLLNVHIHSRSEHEVRSFVRSCPALWGVRYFVSFPGVGMRLGRNQSNP